MKALILAAAVAVAFTGFATAKEVKKDTTKAPVVASKTMTDADMDKVTAGSGFGPGAQVILPGQVSGTAFGGGIGQASGNAGSNPATLGAGL